MTDADQRRRTAAFFLGMLHQGEAFPLEEWEAACKAYSGSSEPEGRKRSNRFRRQIDTQMAYYHQKMAQPQVVPLEGLAEDGRAKLEAECEQGVLRYLIEEIGLKATVARALRCAQLRNIGIVFHQVDRLRGLPAVRYIRPQNVAWDRDCGGDLRRASWVAVIEYVSPETLHVATGYPLEKLKKAATKTAAFAGESPANPGAVAVTRISVETHARVTECLSRCRFVRFFARNEIALYDRPPPAVAAGPEDAPHLERYLTAHGLTEPRRYLELVDGIDESLTDDDEWPEELALDTDEWPITVLPLNDGEAEGTVAGGTDYRHLQMIDDAYDQTLRDIDHRMALALVLKLLLSPNLEASAAELKQLLVTDKVEALKGCLDASGQPLLRLLEAPPFPAVLPEVLEILKAVGDEQSSVNDIQMGGDAQPQETATATQTRTDAAGVAVNARRTALETFEAEIYRKMLAMAHAVCPSLSTVEIVDPVGAPVLRTKLPWTTCSDPEAAAALAAMGAVTDTCATKLLESEGAELVEFGVEAMVGPKLAVAWREKVCLAVSRRSCRVQVEIGTTRIAERMDRFGLLREVLITMLLPLYQAAQRLDLWAEAVKRILAASGLSELDHLLPDIPATQAAAVPPAALPVAPVAGVEPGQEAA